MKYRELILIVVNSASMCFGQGFINLGFNEPDISSLEIDPRSKVPFGSPSQLVPGWTITVGGAPSSKIWYNATGPYQAGLGVTVGRVPQNFPAEFGAYTLSQSGSDLVNNHEVGREIRISQTGTVPANAQALRFYSSGSPILFINSTRIDYDVNGQYVNVGQFAGSRINLEFVFPNKLGTAGNPALFDIIGFVPEPGVNALGILGIVLLVIIYKRS